MAEKSKSLLYENHHYVWPYKSQIQIHYQRAFKLGHSSREFCFATDVNPDYILFNPLDL